MKKLFYVLIAVMFVVVSANAQRPHRGQKHKGENLMACITMPREDLNYAEKDLISRMAQEEKMAFDFYYTMYNKWNFRMFQKIMNSELRHKSVMVQLLDKYDLDNPVNDNLIGKYSDNDLQKVYNDLLSKGNTSLKDALIAAATLEELDYVDFQKAKEATDNADLRLAFTNMQKVTEQHLRAAVRQLMRLYNYDYEPQHIDKATFDKIMQPQGHAYGNHHRGMKRMH